MPRPRLEVDFLSKVPPYRQLVTQIRDWIGTGEPAGGERIWSAADIHRETTVAIMTGRRVLRELEEEGLVVIVPSRGTFIRPRDG